jgi:hypothetical protein
MDSPVVVSGRADLNRRPHGPEPCALAGLSHAPRRSPELACSLCAEPCMANSIMEGEKQDAPEGPRRCSVAEGERRLYHVNVGGCATSLPEDAPED